MKRALLHVGMFLLGCLVATVGAELAFRLCGDRPTLDLAGLYTAFGPDGLYKLRDNVDTEADWASGHLTVHTDSLGLRCDDSRRIAIKPGETVDAIFLGDSQGFGNGLSFSDTLAGWVADAGLREGFKVVNAAVGGHSGGSQLMVAQWLRDEQKVSTSNYVLLATPALIHSGVGLARARVGRDGRLYDVTAGRLASVRMWVKTHLAAYARVRDAARNSGHALEPSHAAQFAFGLYQIGAAEEQQRASFAEYVGRLNALAASQGARIWIVYLPLTIEADFGPVQSAATAAGIHVDADVPLRACLAASSQYNVPLINLRPALDRLHHQGDLLHLPGDFHYNRELSHACGEVVWTALRQGLRNRHYVSFP